jgi:benzoyl-CoA reductase/2-hydroxyglutaryl-CoA dehydratase subunit BcrC/BadD/HgdB
MKREGRAVFTRQPKSLPLKAELQNLMREKKLRVDSKEVDELCAVLTKECRKAAAKGESSISHHTGRLFSRGVPLVVAEAAAQRFFKEGFTADVERGALGGTFIRIRWL